MPKKYYSKISVYYQITINKTEHKQFLSNLVARIDLMGGCGATNDYDKFPVQRGWPHMPIAYVFIQARSN